MESLKRRLEVVDEELGERTSASHASALRETKLTAEVEAAKSEAARTKHKLREVEGQLESERERMRSMDEQAGLEILALKVNPDQDLQTPAGSCI